MPSILFLLVLLGVSAAGPAARATAEAELIAQRIRQQDFRADPTRVPPAIVGELPALKHVLRDEVLAGLASGRALEDVQRDVLADWGSRGLLWGEDSDAEPDSESSMDDEALPADADYAHVTNLEVHAVEGHPDLLTVSITLSIPYGADTSLYVVERATKAIVISVESDGYTEITGANNQLDFAVSRRATDGSWFLVTGSANAWPTSNWQGLRVSAWKPGSSKPSAAFEDGIWIGGDEPAFRLAVTADDFAVRYTGDSFDGGRGMRQAEACFRRSGGSGEGFTRAAPKNITAADFVDEWIQASANQARSWTRPGQRDRVMDARAALDPDSGALEISDASSCGDGDTWLVSLDRLGPGGVPADFWSVLVSTQGALRVEDLVAADEDLCGRFDQ